MIEFLEGPHIYLVDGIEVISVTQIIHRIFPSQYKGISKATLGKAAGFGTAVHKAIELTDVHAPDLSGLGTNAKICMTEYLRLCERNRIEPKIHEHPVAYKHIYAGTLDMIATVEGKPAMLDIKTTSNLYKEYLEWQLGLYAMAYEDKVERYFAIWLPKGGLGELVEIAPKTEDECIEKLKELNLIEEE